VCLSLNEKQRVQRFLFLRYFYVASQPARCWINCTFIISDVGPYVQAVRGLPVVEGGERKIATIYTFLSTASGAENCAEINGNIRF